MDSTAIASMAMSMQQAQFANSLGIAMTKKSMETMETQAQGLIEMAQNLPKFAGEVGSVLDVKA
ncbi:MAG: YjfB family protein [Ruminococcus sp.]|nr:YjfB family protein [Ruminococcus sp.]